MHLSLASSKTLAAFKNMSEREGRIERARAIAIEADTFFFKRIINRQETDEE